MIRAGAPVSRDKRNSMYVISPGLVTNNWTASTATTAATDSAMATPARVTGDTPWPGPYDQTMTETSALASRFTPLSRRTMAMFVSLLLAVAAAVVAHPQPAHAGAYQCPTGAICAWRGEYMTGNMAFWRPSTIGDGVRLNSEFRRDVSSIWNRSGVWVRAMTALTCPRYTDSAVNIPPGAYWTTLTAPSTVMENGLYPDNAIGSLVVLDGRTQRAC